jgi:NAD(P)-dependent dehydrogenase (short-subunit alcohol dehydrogenase family)
LRRVQTPIGSGLSAHTTADEVVAGTDLHGKTAIVTGGYSGLGRETVRVLRQAGANVIVPARDVARSALSLEGIDVEIVPLDLLDPASIAAFADDFVAIGEPLHLLIANAGVMAGPLARDLRGIESQFAINHVGHFQLATALWPALVRAQGARVISVSSWGHHFSPVVFDDPNFERREYDPWSAYGQSKTANILFALAADERGRDHGIRAFSVHPGSIAGTGLQKHVGDEEQVAAGVITPDGRAIVDPERNLKCVEQGAATSIWCATSSTLDGLGGLYCENCDVAILDDDGATLDLNDSAKQFGVAPYAVDSDAADRLWRLSEKLRGGVGVG